MKESDVQLYLIGNEGDGALRQLAEDRRPLPGPRTTVYELGNICSQIVKEVKNQYLLGYRPTNQTKTEVAQHQREADPAKRYRKLNVRPKRATCARSELTTQTYATSKG